ncbi:MAG: hypothetical protein O7H41_15000 [Planctomycetota bacterium]|nr:hypothetical protein [Planctomycetota bacterium]
MKLPSIFVVGLLSILTMGCTSTGGCDIDSEEARQIRERAQARLEKEAAALSVATKSIANSLKGLEEEELAAVAALVLVSERVGALQATRMGRELEIPGRFTAELQAVSPILGRASNSFVSALLACADEMIAYGVAMSACLEEHEDETECPDVWVADANLMDCQMDQLMKTRVFVVDLFQKLEPPKPFPWPFE